MIFAICLCSYANAQNYDLTQYTHKDGLPQNSIKAIAQDSKGLIWIGTESGLVRFDGLRFKKIKAPLGRSVVIKIKIDRKDRIWVVWYGYPLSVYDPSNNTWHEIKLDSSIIEQVSDITLINNKHFLVGSNQSVLTYVDNDLKIGILDSPVNEYIRNNNSVIHNVISAHNHLIVLLADELIYVDLDTQEYTISKHKVKISFFDPFFSINHIGYLCTFGGIYQLHKDGSLQLIFKTEIKTAYNQCVSKDTKLFYSFDKSGLKAFDVKTKQNHIYRDNDFDNLVFDDTQRIYATKDSIWAITNSTVTILENERITRLPISKDYKFNRVINSAILQSNDGNIWLGTDYSGLFKISTLKNKFTTVNSPTKGPQLYRKAVLENDNIWLAVNEGGIARWNRKQDTWQHYPLNQYLTQSVRAIVKDKYGGIWAAIVDGKLLKYDSNNNQFKLIYEDPKNGSHINVMLIDDQYIWTSTNNQILKFDYENGTDYHFGKVSNQVRAMAFDNNHNLIIGTHDEGLYLMGPDGKTLNHWQDSLTSANIFSVYQDQFNHIWIGTWGGGLNRLDPATGKVQVFNTDNGLSDNTIFGIVAGADNELWLSSYNGLMQFRGCITEDWPCVPSINHFDENDGLQGREFDAESFALLDNGEIYFAGGKGFNLFEPQEFKYNETLPKMLITDIKINGKVYQNKDSSIVLNHDFTKISIEFIAVDYHDPQSNQYQYRFASNDEWIVLSQPRIELTRLKSGNHQLEIRGSNNDGVWTQNPLKINIKVMPPFYLSWQAFTSYFILAFLLLMYWINRREKMLKQQTQRLEKAVNTRTQELKQANIAQNKLYSSISHEIKTPLTVLLAPIEEMREDKSIKAKWLDTIVRQSDELKHFINNLVNMTSLKTSQEIQWGGHEISPYLKSLVEDYQYVASHKAIRLYLKDQIPLNLAVKSYKRSLNIIMNNLLENAIKQTPSNGEIHVVVKQNKDQVVIQVKDNGQGIPEKQLERIFEYGFSNNSLNKENWLNSLGIGLSVSQETANALGGELTVRNRKSGGACFTLKLPIADVGLTPILDHENIIKPLSEGFTHEDSQANVKNNPSVLIVDDNISIQNILTEQLKDLYQTKAVGTAEEGIEHIKSYNPDLVICDVMLPNKTGYDLLQEIKTDIATDDTLIIMLTAMEEETAKLKSMEFHADAHLSKPYNKKELLLTINNLLHLKKINQQRALFQQMSQNLNGSEKPTQKASLYQRILDELEEKYSDQYFKAPQMAESMHLSLSSLQRKLKAETHLTLGQIIYSFRINKAKAMLQQNKPITTVALDCGFANSSHFSTKFKSIANMTPKQYINSIKA